MAYPIILLVAMLAFLATGFGGYRYGYSRAEDAAAARVAAAQVEAIAAANRDVEAATARAVEQAKVEAAQRLAATTIRLKGERDAALKAKPECARDATSLGLLNSAIDLANGDASATGSVPDPVRPASETTGR